MPTKDKILTFRQNPWKHLANTYFISFMKVEYDYDYACIIY